MAACNGAPNSGGEGGFQSALVKIFIQHIYR
jgi:hypothetical protein